MKVTSKSSVPVPDIIASLLSAVRSGRLSFPVGKVVDGKNTISLHDNRSNGDVSISLSLSIFEFDFSSADYGDGYKKYSFKICPDDPGYHDAFLLWELIITQLSDKKEKIPELLSKLLKSANKFDNWHRGEKDGAMIIYRVHQDGFGMLHIIKDFSGAFRIMEDASDKYGMGITNRVEDFSISPQDKNAKVAQEIFDILLAKAK